jgi:hypothetical protein
LKQYGRRDFLRALGIGAAALAVAPELAAKSEALFYPPESLEVEDVAPLSFPWEFYGETELNNEAARFEHANLIAVATSEPPEGFTFAARGVYVGLREDVKLDDMKRFLDSWRIAFHSGHVELFDLPVFSFISGSAIPLFPEIGIPAGQPLQLSIHGKPFPLTGPPIVLGAMIRGVGIKDRQRSPQIRAGNAGGKAKC